MSASKADILAKLDTLSHQELKRYLVNELTNKKLGLSWESDLIDREKAINSSIVLPKIDPEVSKLASHTASENLIIEGDNFDSLRLLNATHRGRVRVIYIDPPYNTGSQDFVYNDNFLKKDDRWKHSKWLEFLFQRLTLARDLLTPDGVIMVSINDENRSKLEMLMDEVMPGRRLGSFVWRVRSGGNDTMGSLLSINHEHVLVYGNPSFTFRGDERNEASYTNSDDDSRGPWGNDNLVKAHNAKQRPEAYYHIRNPDTDIWYPCDPDSVWRFSSTSRPLRKELQADPIEVIISEKRILWPDSSGHVVYSTLAELKKGISSGAAPKQLKIYKNLAKLGKEAQSDAKVERLLNYIEPIEFWVGKKIGTKKPRYKRFQKDLKRDVRPVSSWLQPAAASDLTLHEESTDDLTMLTVGATGEGTTAYKKIMNNKDFPYPKPNSLLRALLDQATRPGDTVLDFFAGSGTTGHAVLELNAQDNGNRKFILCSSTEATAKDLDKNLCRDVCAERIRRVMDGYGTTEGLGGDFAYLTMDLVEEADLDFEATPEHAFHLISLRETGSTGLPPAGSPIWEVARAGHGSAVIVCPSVNDEAFAALKALNLNNLVVYSARPGAVEDALEGVCAVDSRNLDEALRYAQSAHAASRSANIANLATTEAAV